MYWYSSQVPELSSRHEQALERVEISSERGPGTILHDFDALLSYVAEREMRITSRQQLPLAALPEINERLKRHIQQGLKRPQQKSYPHIHGLYLLLRVSGLTYVGATGRKLLLLVDGDQSQEWQKLNPTERYFALLESWLLRGRPEIIRERGAAFREIPENFGKSMNLLLRIPESGLLVSGNSDVESGLSYRPGWYNLALLDLFGLVDVRPGAPVVGKGWQIERIGRTLFGEALLTLLYAEFFGDIDNIFRLEEEPEIPFGILQPALLPYFPEWRNNLSLSEWKFREGVHIFKVSLGSIWRRIAVPAGLPLDALASAILSSVDFDHDHLYEFTYQNPQGALREVHHPYMSEGPWTSEVLVGEVPLHIGQTMTYLFDFGDEWTFDVTLERVDQGMDSDKVWLLDERGKSPEQYPIWDD